MKRSCTVWPCLFAFAVANYLAGVDTTPLPARESVVGGPPVKAPVPPPERPMKEISFTNNKIRTKRGIPCPMIDDTDCDWERTKPFGCGPCDNAIRNANEARLLRKQHRKIVTEMKINRLKHKLHSAVCPTCALAHEREHMGPPVPSPCNKPHVDITVVMPDHPDRHIPERVPVPDIEYPPLPPPRPSYTNTKVMETGAKAIQMEQYSEPAYNDVPMVPMIPAPQYEPVPLPEFRPEMPQFGPAVPWMRSSAPTADIDGKKSPNQGDEVEISSPRRRRLLSREDQDQKTKTSQLQMLFPMNLNTTTKDAPSPFEPAFDQDDAKPWKNATYYDETSLTAPPPDDLWQSAYSAALKAISNVSTMNESVTLDSSKSSKDLPVRVIRDCSGGIGECTQLCLGKECLENEERQTRNTFGLKPIAGALLTGLVSAIIGA